MGIELIIYTFVIGERFGPKLDFLTIFVFKDGVGLFERFELKSEGNLKKIEVVLGVN